MEKLVPLFIGLAIFAFKSYQNYQKEQETALKRRKAQQPIPARQAVEVNPVKLPKYQQSVQKSTPPPPAKYAEHVNEMNEIQRFKKERELRVQSYKREKLVEEQHDQENIMEDFDLRKAIVMSTILDRPYQ